MQILVSLLRLARGLFVLTSCLLLLTQPAAAAGNSPQSMRLAQPESLVAAAQGAGASYALRTCQVVGYSGNGACYDPYQMRTAYQIDSLIGQGYDGTGRTIVIVDAFQNPNLGPQVDVFDTYYGLPTRAQTNYLTQIAPDGLTTFVPGDENMTGWAEEISLDVEWSHAIAPGAKIVLVLAKTNLDADILSAVKYAVDNNLGDVISMSFGENESCVDPDILSSYHDVFASATLKGITLFASSGDQGAAQPTCDGNSWVQAASHPASDPLVSGVGGTELHAAPFCIPSFPQPSGSDCTGRPAPGTYQSEIAWNEGYPFGDFQNVFGSTLSTGGGFSVLFGEPAYQKILLPGGTQRAVPDVAYNAAVLHGVLTYLDIPGVTAGFYRFGGTSAGAPQWAAITAIADQIAGTRLGFLNSAFYQIGRVSPAYAASFHDVITGTNAALEYDYLLTPVVETGFTAGTRWDATTGTGTPRAPSLVNYLLSYTSPGDAAAAVATTKPKPHPKPIVPGRVSPD